MQCGVGVPGVSPPHPGTGGGAGAKIWRGGEWALSRVSHSHPWVEGGRAGSTFTDSPLRPLVTHSTCRGQGSDLCFLDKETEASYLLSMCLSSRSMRQALPGTGDTAMTKEGFLGGLRSSRRTRVALVSRTEREGTCLVSHSPGRMKSQLLTPKPRAPPLTSRWWGERKVVTGAAGRPASARLIPALTPQV